MKKILKWVLSKVNGKKATIVAILGLTITLCLKENYIDTNWSIYLEGILVLLAGGANIANARLSK